MEEKYIKILIESNNIVNIYLMNGIKLRGIIFNYEKGVLLLDGINNNKILIYTHAISTIEKEK